MDTNIILAQAFATAPPSNTYCGVRHPEGAAVRVGTTDHKTHELKPYDLPLRLDVVDHSPLGFDWGYSDSGSSQLAFAILAHALKDDDAALARYYAFKAEVVVNLPRKAWLLMGFEVKGWVADYDRRVSNGN